MTTEQTVETEPAISVKALVVRPSIDIIRSEDDAQPWRAFMQDQVACRKRIEEQFKPIKDAAYNRHRALCSKEKEIIAEFVKGEADAKAKLEAFVVEENARREEEARIAHEQARKEAIAQAKADGDKALATAIKNGDVPVAAPTPPPAPVKIEGFSTRTEKRGRVTDMIAFVKWVARTGNVGLLDVNESELNAMVKRQQGAQKIDGVQIYEKQINSSR